MNNVRGKYLAYIGIAMIAVSLLVMGDEESERRFADDVRGKFGVDYVYQTDPVIEWGCRGLVALGGVLVFVSNVWRKRREQ